jgi:uncharacterized membrane protein
MPSLCQSSGGENSAKGPWDPAYYPASGPAISMTGPRSALPWSARRILWVAVAVSAVLSLRFAMIGVWPVLIFSVLDIGGLYVALHMFSRSRPPEERLQFHSDRIEFERINAKGRSSKIALPAYWTRLETQERPDGNCRLWLVFRQERHPIGTCLGATGRRAIAPQIQHALQSQRI